MPFFEATNNKKGKYTKQTEPNSISKKRATKLYLTLKRERRLQRKYDNRLWAIEIETLTTERKDWEPIPEWIVDKVLDWFDKRCNQDKVPRVWSTKSFVLRFGELWDLMDNEIGPLCEKISPLAKQLVKELTDVWDYPHWPGVSREQMPAAVQLSLDAYSEFFDKACIQIKKVISKCKRTGGMGNNILEHKNRETERFAQYLDEIGPRSIGCLPDPTFPLTHPDAFVKRWFGELYHLRKDWDKWNGKLNREVWSLDHSRFQQQMLSWSDIKGDKEHWHQLMELVGE